MFTSGIEDVDLSILLRMDDQTLEEHCYTNDYVHQLCLSPQLWKLKIEDLYPTFPFHHQLIPIEWKKLYYKLKYKDFTAIVVWAQKNEYSDILDWLSHQKDYLNYFKYNFGKFLDSSENQSGKTQVKIIINFLNFLYNNKIFIDVYPEFRSTIKKILTNYALYVPQIKDIMKVYMKSIFDESLDESSEDI